MREVTKYGAKIKKTTNLNTEFQVLLCACQVYFHESGKASFHQLISEHSINWEELLYLAAVHKIRPILFHSLTAVQSDAIPPDFLNQLKLICRQITLSNLKKTKELLRLFRLFEKENLTVVPYKGVVLAHTVFGNIGHREFSDIDLLIHLEEFSKIEKILLEEGYQHEEELNERERRTNFKHNCEYNFDYYENGIRVFHVEPHWTLSRRMYHVFVALEDLSDHFTTIPIAQNTLPVLDVEANFMAVCIHHGVKDNWRILKLICDITAIVQHYEATIDWEKLLNLSRKFGVLNVVLLGLSLSQRLFDTPLPLTILDEINRASNLEKLGNKIIAELSQVVSPKKDYHFGIMLLNVRMRARISDRWGIVFNHIRQIAIPSTLDYELISFPHSLHFLYYLIRPFRLLIKYVGGVFIQFFEK